MIKKLQIRFIIASMLALTTVLLVILGGINLMSYRKTILEADEILNVLADNGGRFPPRIDWEPERKTNIRKGMSPNGAAFGKHELSPETPFESRFFTVTFNSDGSVTDVDIKMIASVDQETAVQCGKHVWESGTTRGFWGSFRYLLFSGEDNIHIVFLDCGRSLSHFHSTLLTSIAIATGGLIAVLVLLILFSGRIVKPVAESYEKQKRFITDAGHEIKTPLTIIGADLDLAEMTSGENEWLQDIRLQVNRLTELTNDLIMLSRIDEEQVLHAAVEFPISDIVEETAQSFQHLATCQGKSFLLSVQPMLSMVGCEKDIRKLVSVLTDNAVKYTQEGGKITITLEQKGKNLLLSVTNTVQETISEPQIRQLFDRFYRVDPSRSNISGHGLGLSIAKGIVTSHKGTIQATGNANSLSITVLLPAKK